MFATLTIVGSSGAVTQTACGRSARAIRRATIACSSRSLAEPSSCSPRWSSTAGSAERRIEPASATVCARGAVAAHEQLRRGGHERVVAAARAEHVTGRESRPAARRTRPRRRAARARGPRPRARARSSRSRRRGCARPRARRPPRSARAARPRRSGSGPPAPGRAAAAAPRAARPRAASRRAASSSGTSSGAASAATVRRTSSPRRASATSGTTRSAAANADQCGAAPPSGANAKPPTATGPAPGGPSGASATAPASSARQAEATRPKRPGPDAVRRATVPSAASAAPSRSGCSKQNQSSPARREAKTIALGSPSARRVDGHEHGAAEPPRLAHGGRAARFQRGDRGPPWTCTAGKIRTPAEPWSTTLRSRSHETNSYSSSRSRSPRRSASRRVAVAQAADDPAVAWNRTLVALLRTPGLQPATVHPTRSYALLHVAIFDAVESIARRYRTYGAPVPAPRDASRRAAADAAAHDVLIALFPSQSSTLDVAYADALAAVPIGRRRREGVLVGRRAARRVLLLRARDGSDASPPPYLTTGLPRRLPAHAARLRRARVHALGRRAAVGPAPRRPVPPGAAARDRPGARGGPPARRGTPAPSAPTSRR